MDDLIVTDNAVSDFLRRRIHPSYQWRVLDRHGGQGTYIGGRLGANCTRACALSPSKYAYLHATSIYNHSAYVCWNDQHLITNLQVASGFTLAWQSNRKSALGCACAWKTSTRLLFLPRTSPCQIDSHALPFALRMLLQSLPCTFLEKRSSTYEFTIHACVVSCLPLPILFWLTICIHSKLSHHCHCQLKKIIVDWFGARQL